MALEFTQASSMRVNLGTDIDVLKAVGGCTLMAWINPTTVNSAQAWLSIGIGPPPGASANSRANFEMNSSGGLQCGFRATDAETAKSITVASQFSIGVWGHHAVTCNYGGTSNNLIGYKNGVQTGTASATFSATTTANTNSKNAAVGSGDDGAAPFANGILEDVRVYNRVLTAGEIRAIYEARGPDNIINGMQMWYLLRELSVGTAATAASSNKDFGTTRRDGSPVNSPVYRAGPIRDYAALEGF
jgi:hypothetical protein